MITLYTGTPGSGKSLHTMERIKSWISIYDCPVIGNIKIKTGRIKSKKYGGYIYLDFNDMSRNLLEYIALTYYERSGRKRKEGSLLLIVDEAQMYFNSRSWAKKDRLDWISFFSVHRHLGYDVILCCQYDTMIDTQMRDLVEYQYDHRKIKNLGLPGQIINILSGGKLHYCREYYYPLKEKIGGMWFKADKSIYYLYDTFESF